MCTTASQGILRESYFDPPRARPTAPISALTSVLLKYRGPDPGPHRVVDPTRDTQTRNVDQSPGAWLGALQAPSLGPWLLVAVSTWRSLERKKCLQKRDRHTPFIAQSWVPESSRQSRRRGATRAPASEPRWLVHCQSPVGETCGSNDLCDTAIVCDDDETAMLPRPQSFKFELLAQL